MEKVLWKRYQQYKKSGDELISKQETADIIRESRIFVDKLYQEAISGKSDNTTTTTGKKKSS